MFKLGVNQGLHKTKHWKKWVNLITKGGAILELKKAAIIPDNGTKSIHSKGFTLSEDEISTVFQCFLEPEQTEIIRVSGCTYCLKSACSEQVVAFNGGRYLILTKTQHVVIVAVCESRDKLNAASTWLLRIASHLR